MEFLIAYSIFCLLVGWLGSSTTLGFGSAFLLSIILTPVTGFIVCLFYPGKEHRDQKIKLQQQNNDLIRQALSNKSVADELLKLQSLRESGVINEEEFQIQKSKILA